MVGGELDEAFHRGERAYAACNFAEAIEHYQASLDIEATLAAYLNLGNALMNSSSFDEAEEVLGIGLQMAERSGNRDFLGAFNANLSIGHLHRGRLDEAMISCEGSGSADQGTQSSGGAAEKSGGESGKRRKDSGDRGVTCGVPRIGDSTMLQRCDTPESCDTMVAPGAATTTGSTLFAKNSDRPADECQPLVQHPRQSHLEGAVAGCQFVSVPQVSTTYSHVGSRPYWCWGYEHGFNEHQVVIGNEAVHSRFESALEPKLIGMELIRLGLERSRSAAEAVEVMTTLVSRHGQGKFDNDGEVRTYDNSYIVADPKEAYVIETAGHHWAVADVRKPLGISNVYSLQSQWSSVSDGAEELAIERGWAKPGGEEGRFNFAGAFSKSNLSEGSGARRRGRSCAVLEQRTGGIDARTMMALLSDHSDGEDPSESFRTGIREGTSICAHGSLDGSGGNTAASLVADLCVDDSRLAVYWCSLYSPCLSLFLPFFTIGTLPGVLSLGDASPSEESPWWLCHQMNYAVRRAGEEAVEEARQAWAGLQEELFESAGAIAVEARELIDGGREGEAQSRLSEYMRENTARMLEATRARLRVELVGA